MYYILHSSSTSAAHDPALHLLLKQAWDLVMGSYSQHNIIILLFAHSIEYQKHQLEIDTSSVRCLLDCA
jgi:hypothetical protein